MTPAAVDHLPGHHVLFESKMERVAPLPASIVMEDGLPFTYTLWDLTFEERIALLGGAKVMLRIMGTMVPPVLLAVEPDAKADE